MNDELVLVFDGSGSPSVRSFQHTGLTPGLRYRYQVSSVSTAGEGNRSAVATFVAAVAPSAPPQPKLVLSEPEAITIGLDPPSSDGGAPLVQYIIFYDDGLNSGQLTNSRTICDLSVTSFVVDGLTRGREYKFQVQALSECAGGESPEPLLDNGDAPECPVGYNPCTLAGEPSAASASSPPRAPQRPSPSPP
ncbi:unnamed protein product [Prorocentrum cordatum]|uniref:Fibronectin type-III domain-containing protein n=1 Tax=Prorocentrum cordatum TaxID=2364126 RepID=A0ABN9TCL3_9DINO|nr:unnamed protein product [Polarella glacialis]